MTDDHQGVTEHPITAADYYGAAHRYQGTDAGPGEQSLYMYFTAMCRAEGVKPTKGRWDEWLGSLAVSAIHPILRYVNGALEYQEGVEGEDPTSA